jgi:hypothetical protein
MLPHSLAAIGVGAADNFRHQRPSDYQIATDTAPRTGRSAHARGALIGHRNLAGGHQRTDVCDEGAQLTWDCR